MTSIKEKLEREIEASRSRLDATLTHLQDRLHPVSVVDELIGIGRRSGPGADIFSLAMHTVRRSPVPVLLFCVGVAWLVSGTKRGADGGIGGKRSIPISDPEVPQRRARARIYPASV